MDVAELFNAATVPCHFNTLKTISYEYVVDGAGEWRKEMLKLPTILWNSTRFYRIFNQMSDNFLDTMAVSPTLGVNHWTNELGD